ncbi:glycosyltransferase [Zobellia galactanivorans]|uniref:Capsular polysaccharide biosynthesis glycosyltransferase, family GT4 n=1 Tax=Zobellia galactanivorans (strain DSM 12802 / CCUG 47099 / CIP 106680 / NCIMB 13871 / Dsij) TaxID=63186 RepID=G0L829_ZOBGA|nr:glycosyltransferase [Zobellia galactanivorans]CAZ97897.1 Capsular polysaccharide biosynthesis glycosyltransferase, family GT4 [Zobellia galactanivorans]
MKRKLFRIAAAPGSLAVLLNGQLRYMNDFFDVTGVASEGSQHQTIRDSEGIRTVVVNIDRKINLWADIVSLYKLFVLFKKEKPDIIHSITPKAGLLSMVAGYLAGVPYRLHTFTGLVFPTQQGLIKHMLIFFDRIICFCATHIYPEGRGVKKDLTAYKITRKPLKIIGHGNVNGIDLDHFDPMLYPSNIQKEIRKNLHIDESDFIWSFVGRIGFDKGIEEMITSFVQVQKESKNSKLLLVGPYEKDMDPLPPSIEKEIEENEGIISVGWQQDVRPYFAISNVFVFPSYREGFPNVLLQAGAMGKYSIVTNINGSNEIIEDGINGTIIPVKNSDALTHAMLNCLNTPSDYFGSNPKYRQLISEKYSQQFVWSEQLKEYRLLK